MADVMGTQGGMEGIVGAGKTINEASKNFNRGAGIFETSVGDWTFGVLMVKDVFKKFLDGFRGAATGAGRDIGREIREGFKEAFEFGVDIIKNAGWAKLVDTVAAMVGSMYSVRKQFQSTYGAFGKQGNDLTSGINEITKSTNDFGARWSENIAAFGAIADKVGTINFGGGEDGWKGWVYATSLISESFQIGADAAANITSSFMMGGASVESATSFMTDILNESRAAGLAPIDVANNLAASTNSMMRFSQSSSKANSLLKSMAITSTKLGMSIDDMVESMDKYKTIEGAMQGSLDLSLMGINMDAMQLLAQASQNDPTQLYNAILGKLEGLSDSEGTFSNVGRMAANQYAPMLGLSVDQLQSVMKRSKQPGVTTSEAIKESLSLKDKGNKQQTAVANLTDAMYQLIRVISNVTEPLTRFIDWAAQSKAASMTFIVAMLTIGPLLKMLFSSFIKSLGGLIFSIPGRIFGGIAARTTEALGIVGAIGPPGSDSSGINQGGSRPRRNPRGGRGNITEELKSVDQMKGAMYGAAATALQMLAFAGAVWMLSKAFQNFSTVSWKGVGVGVTVMTVFAGITVGILASLKAFGKAATMPQVWLGVGLLLSLGAAIALVGVGIKQAGEGFKQAGEGFSMSIDSIKSLVTSIYEMKDLNINSISAPLNNLIGQLGEQAIKYQEPINQLANGISNLANALSSISTMTIKSIDFESIKKMAEIGNQYPALIAAGNSSSSGEYNFTLYTDISIDGNKVARAVTTHVDAKANGK